MHREYSKDKRPWQNDQVRPETTFTHRQHYESCQDASRKAKSLHHLREKEKKISPIQVQETESDVSPIILSELSISFLF